MIHVRVCAQGISATKTRDHLVCSGFSKPHIDEDTKALIFRVGDLFVMQNDAFTRMVHGEQAPSQSLFLLSRGLVVTSVLTRQD